MKTENRVGQGNWWVKILLVAGVAIAAPRLAGAFGQLIGRDVLTMFWWFASFEVWTGFALAILEGLALAHIADRWKRFSIRSPYWWILAAIQAILLLSLPFVSTVYLVAAQYDDRAAGVLTWSHILNNHLVWLWSYLGAAISTIIVMGIGIVHNVDNDGQGGISQMITTRREGIGTKGPFSVDELAKLYAERLHETTPNKFIEAFEAAQGYRMTVEEAEGYLSAVRSPELGPVKVRQNGKQPPIVPT